MTTETSTQQSTGAPVMTTKDWIITQLITFIPIVGFIMLFVWAFGSNENPNRANWAKASLIWAAIGFVLLFLMWGTILALFLGAASGGGDGF